MIDAATKTAIERLEKREVSGAITSTLIASEHKDGMLADLIMAWRELRRLRSCRSLEGVVQIEEVDGGCAQIAHLGGEEDTGLFARLHSWSDDAHHPEMARLRGHKVRVIVDVID
jgi:hypothetical protein